jgi:hypothetical protein
MVFSKGVIKMTKQDAHQANLDSAQREIDMRDAQGEDMSLAYIDQVTYKIIKLPFPCDIYESGLIEVENRFGGSTCMLVPEALAVYDSITGAEMLGYYQMVQDGCSWFREHYPKEYMVLLD